MTAMTGFGAIIQLLGWLSENGPFFGFLLWLDRVAAASEAEVQLLRFWLAMLNFAWLFPVAVLALVAPDWIKPRFPQPGFAIPAAGLMLGLAGFSAITVFGFDPTTSWRTLMSLLIGTSLAMFLPMGIARWLGYDL